MSRPLLLDGITIQLVGELLFDCGIEREERRRCRELYREALEEFAYAVVFGVTLGRAGSLPERNRDFPGKKVVAYDCSYLFKAENVLPAAAGPAEGVLDNPQGREMIAEDLRLLLDAFPPYGGKWVPYIQQEALTYLPIEPQSSEKPQPGASFLFPQKREIYFHHCELQKEIPPEFTKALVASLVELFPDRPCDDLPEFVERVLLSHYGISCWYEKSARAADFQRMPFITRSCVRQLAIQKASNEGDVGRVIKRVQAVKLRVLSQTLTLAFDGLRTGHRPQLYDELIRLRKHYEEHRQWLAEIDFYSRPDLFDEVRINNAVDQLENRLYGQPTTSGVLTHHWPISNILAGFSSLPRYPDSAYHVFEELKPMTDKRTNINVKVGHSSQVTVAQNIQGAVHQTYRADTLAPPKTDDFDALVSIPVVPPAELRRWTGGAKVLTVAVVFTDIVDSTKLCNELGDVAWDAIRGPHFVRAKLLVQQREGFYIKNTGDGIVALFHDATTAAEFAVTLHGNTGNATLRIRAGLHVGQVSIDDNDAFGRHMNFTARVMGHTQTSAVLASNRVKQDIDQRGDAWSKCLRWTECPDVSLKGFPEPESLWGIEVQPIA